VRFLLLVSTVGVLIAIAVGGFCGEETFEGGG
jgi:hypothetical protein